MTMTTEQKAKAYEEALERARALNNGEAIDVEAGTTTCEYIFPELKESKYERIKKKLLSLIEWSTSYYESGITDDEAKEMTDWIEKQCEPNHTNKIEPKFHKGDWVIGRATENEPRQIAEITEEGYKSTYGGWYGFSFENDMHLWTIKDAKDGDVLAVENMIFIYKTVLASHIVSYCKLFNNKFECFDDGRTCCEGNSKVHPATIEQLENLLKAMDDEGYEFDFEKKELKKIDQNNTDEWIEDYWQHEKVNNSYSYDKGEEIQFDHQGFVRFCKKYCKKPAWSEEDEAMLDEVIKRLHKYSPGGELYADAYFWLKSLKDRV